MPTRVLFGCFLLEFLLGWTALVLVFDGLVGWPLFQQVRATTFPTARGVVTRSELVAVPGEDGPTRRSDLAYDYEVSGRRYTGTRYRYIGLGASPETLPDVAAELPVGTEVRVAYDPDEPGEALLRPGLTGRHLTLIWALTPFNMVMLGGWRMLPRVWRPAFDPADPRTVAPTTTGWLVRLPAWPRAAVFLATLGAITFFGTFVWALGFGVDPPVSAAGGLYIAAVATAFVVAARHVLPVLEVDETTRVLRLLRRRRVEVLFAAVTAVTVVHEEWKDSEGTEHRYHCDLLFGDEPPVRVTSYGESADADALAAWLRERVGLPRPPAP